LTIPPRCITPPITLALESGRYDVAHLLLDQPNLEMRRLSLLGTVALHPIPVFDHPVFYGRLVSSGEKLKMAKRLAKVGGAEIIKNSWSICLLCEHPLRDPSHHLERRKTVVDRTTLKLVCAAS